MSYDWTKSASQRIPLDAGCGNCRCCEEKKDGSLWCARDLHPVTEDCLCCDWQEKPDQNAGRMLQ